MSHFNKSNTKRIWIAYLGKRGGGLHLLRQTEQILTTTEYSLISIVSKDENSSIDNRKIFSTPSPTLIGIWHLFTFPVLSFMYFFRNRKCLPMALVQIMPSPMDYWLDVWCHLFRIKVFRVIHDFEPHPGEMWPTKKAIRIRVNRATQMFVFSRYVSENLQKSYSKVAIQCKLPEEIAWEGVVSEELRKKVEGLSRPIVLFIGRIKKYKGLDFFLDAMEGYSKFDFSILIAGSGTVKPRVQEKISYWNHWLSEAEIDFLLTEADVVVFPYIEASQSGIMPLAIMKNKVILSSEVGALKEQLEGYPIKELFISGDQGNMLKGLEACFSRYNLPTRLQKNTGKYQNLTLGDQVIQMLNVKAGEAKSE
jgi:glycosyltransferase involved in cell wall biosynthesis